MHDWFSHGDNQAADPWRLPLAKDDPWPQHPMKIERTLPDPSVDPAKPTTFVSTDTAWWDGSQIYGDTLDFADAIRTHELGRLKLDEHGLPPKEIDALADLKGSAATSGWGSRCCTRCSCASTTRSATTCTPSTPP